MDEEKFGEGAFQTTRTIFDHPIWRNVNEFRTFFLIYGKANHSKTPIDYGEVKVGRGQWLRSYRQMQKDLEYIENGTLKKYSLKTIYRIVKKLQDDGRILVKDTSMGTLFTVANYELYQGFENYRFEVGKHQVNTEETPSKHQVNNNNNDNNDNNDKKEKDIYVEFVEWFNSVFGKNHKPSAYREKILARLKTYTIEQLKQACLNMKKDPFMMGNNDRNKIYATLEYITRNDKNVDKWLNQVPVNRREVIR